MSPIIPSIQQDEDELDQLDDEDGIHPQWLRNAPLFPDKMEETVHPFPHQPQPPLPQQQQQRQSNLSHTLQQQGHPVQTVSPFQVDLNSFQQDSELNPFNHTQNQSSFLGAGAGGPISTLLPHLDSSPSPAPSHRGSSSSSRSSVSMDGYHVGQQNSSHQDGAGGNSFSQKAVLDEVSILASRFSNSHDPESVDKLLQALDEKGIILEEGMIAEILAAHSQVPYQPVQAIEEPTHSRASRSMTKKMSGEQIQDPIQNQSSKDGDEAESSPASSSIDLNSEVGSPGPESDHDVYQPTTSKKRRSSSHASSSKVKKKPMVKPIPGESSSLPTCPVCFTSFSRVFNLKTHMDTHIPEEERSKPYICPNTNCRKAFSRKSDMKRHAKIHLRK